MPELVLVSENARHFSILLELVRSAGGLGPDKVVFVLLAQFRQNFVHGLWGHEREPSVGAVFGELVGERTKEESAEHGTESGALRRPHTVGETPGSEIVWSKICGKEAVSTNESNGICKNGTRDGVTRAETGARDYRFGVLSLKTSVQLKMVDCTVELLSGSSDLWVRIPFQECLVWPQAKILQKRENLERRTSYKVLTFLKSFKEQQPHFLVASMPMISIHLILEGVPRAPKAPAGCSVLN